MKRINLFLIVLAFALTGANAQRINIPGLDLPQLVITEVRADNEQTNYLELTNMGDTALDLSDFRIYSGYHNSRIAELTDSLLVWHGKTNAAVQGALGRAYPMGMLEAGESFVISNAWDNDDINGRKIPDHNTAVAMLSNQVLHKDESSMTTGWIDRPEWQCYPFDSINPVRPHGTFNLVDRLWAPSNSTCFFLIEWKFTDSEGLRDSTFVDQFNFFKDDNGTTLKGYTIKSIAGVQDPYKAHVMVRKAFVDKGTMKWEQSRGTDASTSEWMVIPETSSKQFAFTTVGHHGIATLEVKAKDASVIQVDEANKTLSVPADIYRRDSLSYYFDLNPGMAWSYTLSNSYEDSAKFTVCTGDTITFYAVGDELESVDYHINVRPMEASVAKLYPTRKQLELWNETGDTLLDLYWSNNFVYGVTNGLPQDSITGVAYDTRIDSLEKYLLKPEGATLEFIYADGEERVDVMQGDIIRVTSEDKSTTKDYALAVNDYTASADATLSVVTWPDINPMMYPRWTMGDTLVEFSSSKSLYVIDLLPFEKAVPAFQFKTRNPRASISVQNAQNLIGTPEQRTTTVTVLAEDDSTSLTYTFQFRRVGGAVQPYTAEPFFSEFIWQASTRGWAIEVFNPGTTPVDMSQYAILKDETGQLTWQQIVSTIPAWTLGSGFPKVYENYYVPGYRWVADGSEDEWNAIPTEDNPYVGKGFLRPDGETNTICLGKDVWVCGTGNNVNKNHNKINAEADFTFYGHTPSYAWSDSTKLYLQANPAWNDAHSYNYLVKIKNDSILDGTKLTSDPADYELIDMFVTIGDSIAGKWHKDKSNNRYKEWFCRKKPSAYLPTTEPVGGWDETAESSDWIAYSSRHADFKEDLPAGYAITDHLGIHSTDPISFYFSTITSVAYKVDLGYEGDLKITGDVTSHTPTTISEFLTKPDPGQTFEFLRGTTPVGADEKLADGDKLVVTSKDQSNQTTYTFVHKPFSSNNSLAANAGSGLTVSGTVVSGVMPGTLVKDLLMKVSVDPTAVLAVQDASGAYQSLKVHNRDTMVYDLEVSTNVQLVVIAENGDEAVYTLDFGFTDSDVFLFSTVYPIDQEKKMFDIFPVGMNPVSIADFVYTNEGATYKILDKAGFERTIGYIKVDDVIEVTSKDGTKVVKYQFPDFYDPTLKLNNKKSSLSLELHPNPANELLFISCENEDVMSATIYTLSGQMVINERAFKESINVSSLQSGAYLIQVTKLNGEMETLKFMKR